MKNKISTFVMLASLLPPSAASYAQEAQPQLASNLCFSNSQNLSPGTAAAGEYKVIYGPYTVSSNCASASHGFVLRTQSGIRWPLTVEKLVGGTWGGVSAKNMTLTENSETAHFA
jgi:hypothetical protein